MVHPALSFRTTYDGLWRLIEAGLVVLAATMLLAVFLQVIFRYSGGESLLGFWEGLAYYPKIIIQEASFSPWLGGLMLLALVKPFIE